MGPLGEVLTQLSKGGGAKGINIEDVTRQLEELTTKYPFQVSSCAWASKPFKHSPCSDETCSPITTLYIITLPLLELISASPPVMRAEAAGGPLACPRLRQKHRLGIAATKNSDRCCRSRPTLR